MAVIMSVPLAHQFTAEKAKNDNVVNFGRICGKDQPPVRIVAKHPVSGTVKGGVPCSRFPQPKKK